MSPRIRFALLMGVLFVGILAYFLLSTDRSTDLVLIGTVDANQVIVSSKITGRIVQLPVDEGQDLKAGDLVATIDNEDLEAQRRAAAAQVSAYRSQTSSTASTAQSTVGDTASSVVNAEANLQAARAQLNEAIANRDLQASDTKRTLSLAQQGVASQQDADRAQNTLRAREAAVQTAKEQVSAAEASLKVMRARLNQARAAESNIGTSRGQLASAEAQLAEAETRLGYSRIVAPISGKVSVRAARPGEVVGIGTPIITIIDLTQTWVYAAVPETDADAVQIGDVLRVRMPSGAIINGKLLVKSAEGDFATQRDVSRTKRDIKTVKLKLLIENPGMKYVPGMTAEVLLPKSKLVSK